MRRGKSNREIIAYLVARYGDFVLYRPPLMYSTYLLWFGPFIGLLIGVVVLIVLVRQRARIPDGEPPSDGTRERLADLLRNREGPKT